MHTPPEHSLLSLLLSVGGFPAGKAQQQNVLGMHCQCSDDGQCLCFCSSDTTRSRGDPVCNDFSATVPITWLGMQAVWHGCVWIGGSFALPKMQVEAGFQSVGSDKSPQTAGQNGNFMLKVH